MKCLLTSIDLRVGIGTTCLPTCYLLMQPRLTLQAASYALLCENVSCGLNDTYANLYNATLCKVFDDI